jgi:thiopurine S-methyltransferase
MNYKKNSNDLDINFWEHKYAEEDIGWDLGGISTPLKVYFNQLTNKELKILIPGAGNSYEAAYLHKQGFTTIDVIDIAHQPLKNLKKSVPSFPKNNLIQKDFFNHNKKYDLIVEQTFFCALHPSLRKKYIEKMASLLEEKGKLIGLLFDVELTDEGPPFGGSLNEYLQLFSTQFNIKILEKCYNSIKPRFGRELFFIFEKK